ncbi:MAG: condensation domain-containing protein [Chloroflexota bacterium]|nr:condensation domain-containing protein [Chloroflexota bacterium]
MSTLDDLSKRRASLSPAKRALLAKIARGHEGPKGATYAHTIPRREAHQDAPLSFLQEWYLPQQDTMPSAVTIQGEIEQALLEQCIQHIVQRHESLRTVFPLIENQLVQVIVPSLRLPLLIEDLRSLPEGEREAEASRQAYQENYRVFDMQQGPLIHLRLLRLTDDTYLFIFTLHHIIADGWSIAQFFRELLVLYEAALMGVPPQLPDLPIQYADYASWQRRELQGAKLDAYLNYWKDYLQDRAVLQVRTDHPRTTDYTLKRASIRFHIADAQANGLKSVSRQEESTVFMTLVAAYALLLSTHSGQEDILLGFGISNRSLHETENVIGVFGNVLPLRIDVSGQPAFRQLLRRVQQSTLGVFDHQDLAYEQVMQAIEPEWNISQHPLLPVKFVLQNESSLNRTRTKAGLTMRPQRVFSPLEWFELNMIIYDTDEGMLGELEYNTALFAEATVARMVAEYQALLEQILSNA